MRRLLAYCAALLLVAGCSLGDSGAERLAKDHAKWLGRQLTKYRVHDSTALELVQRMGNGRNVTYLRAAGAPRDGDAEIVAKIYAEVEGGGFIPDSEATLCFRYRIGEWGEGAESPRVIDCPDSPPLVLPKPSPSLPPSLANVSVDGLIAALKSHTSRLIDPESVRSVVDMSVVEPEATIEAAAVGDWIGFAVRAGSDCILGRVRGRKAEVWVPPAVTIQPGELTCDATAAGHGLATRHPH